MRKTIAAASLAATGLGVLGLGATGALADDGDDGDGRGSWVEAALEGLVDDGTLTRDQAEAVEDALREARPRHRLGPWLFGFGSGDHLATLGETLGVDEDELRDQLGDGRTIAEIAEEQGVDVQDVVDALLAALEERVDEAVADDDLTREEADELLADAEERITDFVNGELPDLPEPPDGRGMSGRHRFPWGPGDDEPWDDGPWDDGPGGHGPGDDGLGGIWDHDRDHHGPGDDHADDDGDDDNGRGSDDRDSNDRSDEDDDAEAGGAT
ncbi:MAG TPA: hypothetical protein VIL48_12955 [Acidimicrobiales bacterium]